LLVGYGFEGKIRSGVTSRPKHSMPKEIAKANIEHFTKLLKTETDARKRAVIERLLAEQEQKLAALTRGSEKGK
jgi:hypothetical protein